MLSYRGFGGLSNRFTQISPGHFDASTRPWVAQLARYSSEGTEGRNPISGKSWLASAATITYDEQGITAPQPTPRDVRRSKQVRDWYQRCEFLYSAAELRNHPINDHAVPEIIVLGASNVGKSTLLNKLFSAKDQARVSKEPGKTTLMNAYGVGRPLAPAPKSHPSSTPPPSHALILMDTPGYGFGSRTEWGENILTYLEKRKALRGALLLLSAEKKLASEDRWILEQLARASARVTVVLTRADKLKGNIAQACGDKAQKVRDEVSRLEASLSIKMPLDIHVTSSAMAQRGDMGGISGIRLAVLDMAGIAAGENKVEQMKEKVSYTGQVVPFDDIKWAS